MGGGGLRTKPARKSAIEKNSSRSLRPRHPPTSSPGIHEMYGRRPRRREAHTTAHSPRHTAAAQDGPRRARTRRRAAGVAQRAGSRGCGRKGEGRHPGMAK